MSHYIQYYSDQAGGGGGVKNVFAGSTFQRGSGIGSFLGGLLRKIVPYLASGAKAVGKEAARAGVNVLDDVVNKRVNFKEAVSTRAKESGRNLKRKAAEKLSTMMKGDGYKSRAPKRARQSKKKRARARTTVNSRSSSGGKKKKVVKRRSTRGRRRRGTTAVRSVTDIFGPK